MATSRRTTIARLSAAAMLIAAGRIRSSEPQLSPLARLPRLTQDPFTLGVASGQPRPDSVILWSRLAPRPHAPDGGMEPTARVVRWELAEDEGFRRIRRKGEVLAIPDLAHSIRVTVGGLPPAREFHYRFICGDAVSRTGRTRTAPSVHSSPDRLRIALASCQHYEQGRFVVHREIARTDVDLVLFVGDYIYDSSNPRFLQRPHEAQSPITLDQFRARHATYKLDPDLQAAHATHPWILAWDDHEVRNDYAAALGGGDVSPAEFVALRAAAYQAYFEHLPLGLDQLPGTLGMRMHDRYAWGTLADLWTLDCRQHRSAQACSPDGDVGGRMLWDCAEAGAPSRSLLGPAQEHWLGRGLQSSRARWRLVGQASQISPCGMEVLGRRVIYTDGWDGYAASRNRLTNHLAQAGIDNVVMLGGDVHRHVAANIRARANEEHSPIVASEFVTTSVTTYGVSDPWMSLMRKSNPDILHSRGDQRGYSIIEVGNRSLHWTARSTEFPVTESARMQTQARFVVEAGRAGPHKA